MIKFSSNQITRSFATLVCLLAIGVSPVVAQENSNVAGKWKITAETDEGIENYDWTIKKSGDSYSGFLIEENDGARRELDSIKVDGKSVSFAFEMELGDESLEIAVEMELVSANELKGKFSVRADGNEVSSGKTQAVRVAKKLKPMAGAWKSTATLPDGNALESEMVLKGKNESLKGTFSTNDGETEIEKISVERNKVQFEMSVDVEGNTVDIVVEAVQKSDDSMKGTWSLMQDGVAAQSGAWVAERSASESDSKVTALFDGSSMDHFRGYATEKIGDGWKIVDGTLHLNGEKKSGDIVTKEQYGSFELEFEWKISKGGNSGVMYRVALDKKRPWHTGPEYQILDDDVHKDGKKPKNTAGSIYALYVPVNKTLKPVGQWNSTRIILDGNKLEHWLNGQKVAQSEIGGKEWNERVAESKFQKQADFGKMKKGHICFQDHGDPVWYRNIKIKSLD